MHLLMLGFGRPGVRTPPPISLADALCESLGLELVVCFPGRGEGKHGIVALVSLVFVSNDGSMK